MPLACLSLQRVGDFAKACDCSLLVNKCYTKNAYLARSSFIAKFRSELPEVESRTQGSRPRTQKKSKAKDSLSEDRHSRGQGHKRKCSPKKKRSSQKFFRRSPKKKKKRSSQKFFKQSPQKTFSKKFFKRSTKF